MQARCLMCVTVAVEILICAPAGPTFLFGGLRPHREGFVERKCCVRCCLLKGIAEGT